MQIEVQNKFSTSINIYSTTFSVEYRRRFGNGPTLETLMQTVRETGQLCKLEISSPEQSDRKCPFHLLIIPVTMRELFHRI